MAGGGGIAVLGPSRCPVGLEQLLFDAAQRRCHRGPAQRRQQPIQLARAPEARRQVDAPQRLGMGGVLLDPVGVGALPPILHRPAEIRPCKASRVVDKFRLVAAKNSAVRPAASDASTAACRWLISPAANASAVAGMVRSRRPNHAWARAWPTGSRQWCASHAPHDRDPSSA
jgi:hypothetical protein